MAARAFFNLGTAEQPGHGDYTATLTLPPTAAFAALLKIDGAKLPKKALAEWLEDWHEFLLPEYAEGEAALARAITAIRKITIKSKSESTSTTGTFNAARSALEEVEAQSSNDLPIGLDFVCEPYLGPTSRGFHLPLSVLTGDDKPVLVLRWQQREVVIEKIAQELKNVLAEQLGGTATLTIGTFNP